MQIIHTPLKKRKKKKLTAKQRELQSAWEKLLKKYEPKKKAKSTTEKPSLALSKPAPYRRETRDAPSLGTHGSGACTKTVSRSYTGTAIIGIATLHKSNAVPVFSQEEAIEISRMRRG